MGFLFNPYFTIRNGLTMSKIFAKFKGSNRPGRTGSINIYRKLGFGGILEFKL